MLREEQNPSSHQNPPCCYWVFPPYFLQSSQEGQEGIWRSEPPRFWQWGSTAAAQCWLGSSGHLREITAVISSRHTALQPRLEEPPQHKPFHEDHSQFNLAGKEGFWAESGDKSMTLPKEQVCWWYRDDSAGASWASGSGGDKHPDHLQNLTAISDTAGAESISRPGRGKHSPGAGSAPSSPTDPGGSGAASALSLPGCERRARVFLW